MRRCPWAPYPSVEEHKFLPDHRLLSPYTVAYQEEVLGSKGTPCGTPQGPVRRVKPLLGRHPKGDLQTTPLTDWEKTIPAQSIYADIRNWQATHVTDDQYQSWYAPIGRPSKPPSVIITLTMLQFRTGLSDREAVDNARYDDRWKFALGLSRDPEVTIDHSTLARYRARLLQDDFGRQLLKTTLQDAAEAGLLSHAEDLIDSFMIAGAAARRGTLTLIRSGIHRVLTEYAESGIGEALPTLSRNDYDNLRRKPAITWSSAAARQTLLNELVADGRALVQWAAQRPESAPALPTSLQQALDLLALVLEQDIEPDPDHPDQVRIAQKVAQNRVLSDVDPDLRHGRKTSSEKFDGYKGHISVQNRPVGEGAFITGVVVTGGNVADGDATVDVLADREDNLGALPDRLMGDTAFGGMPTRKAVAAQYPDVALEAPVPPAVGRAGCFSKTDFQIDWEAETITCPHGITVAIPSRLPEDSDRRVIVRFPKSDCQGCPLKAQCTSGDRGRTISLDSDDPVRQAERERQQEAAWQTHYRERSRMEHTVHRVVAHGGRHSRYWGQRKADFQLRIVSAVQNIEEWFRVLRRQGQMAVQTS